MPRKKKPEHREENPVPDHYDGGSIADRVSQVFGEGTEKPIRESKNANERNSTISLKSQNPLAPTAKDANPRVGEAEREGVDEEPQTKEAAEEAKDRLPGPYVPASLSFSLQEAQVRLRRMTGEKISLSLIIEAALALCLRDFDERSEASALAREVRRRS